MEPDFRYGVNKIRLVNGTLSSMNPVHMLTTYYLKNFFIFPPICARVSLVDSILRVLRPKICMHFSSLHFLKLIFAVINKVSHKILSFWISNKDLMSVLLYTRNTDS
jgi:hypothetical protein